MRTNLKSLEYFRKEIYERENSFYEIENKLANGTVPESRVPDVKVYLTDISFNILFLKYASGTPLAELNKDYCRTANLVFESWDDRFIAPVNKKNKGEVVYILEAYYNMLLLLSLGFFTEAEDDIYLKLNSVLERNGVSDTVFNFLVSSKINIPLNFRESYSESSFINNVYGNLKKAIRSDNASDSEKFLLLHINDWYKKNRDAVWYNSHKSDLATFYGYWSFETAALVKIKGLDDSALRANPHYPKDLFLVN